MLKHVLKIQPLKAILEFQDWKRGYETYTKNKKKKVKAEIKPIIENLQDELYQLENKQAKGEILSYHQMEAWGRKMY